MGWPISRQAESILRRSHGVVCTVDASIAGADFVTDVQLADGSGQVTVDSKSSARRKLTASLLSTVDSPEVSPHMSELRVWYTLVDDASGKRYPIPVGTFVITEVRESKPGVVSVTGVDRWQRVQDARFPSPITTSGNTVAAIRTLITGADSRIDVVIDAGVSTSATHRVSVWERDRDQAIRDLAQSIGATVFFDPMGIAHIAPIPSLSAAPYWTISTGDGGVQLGREKGVSRGNTYNGVSVTGDTGGQTAPVSAFAWDDDPTSITYWGGPYGMRPRFYQSSLVTTRAQAYSTAQSMLASVTGISRTLTVISLAHPGLDGGDVIVVEDAEDSYKPYLVGSFTLPLGLGSIAIDARTTSDSDDDQEGMS